MNHCLLCDSPTGPSSRFGHYCSEICRSANEEIVSDHELRRVQALERVPFTRDALVTNKKKPQQLTLKLGA